MDEMWTVIITWLGTILTAIATVTTILQTIKAGKYKKQIEVDLRKIFLNMLPEILKEMQRIFIDIDGALNEELKKRGKNWSSLEQNLNKCFDEIFTRIVSCRDDEDIITTIQNLQTSSRLLFTGATDEKKEKCQCCREQLQNIIMQINKRIYSLERRITDEQ